MIKDRLKEFEDTRRKHGLSIPTQSENIPIELDDGHSGALLLLLDKIGPLYARVKVSKSFKLYFNNT